MSLAEALQFLSLANGCTAGLPVDGLAQCFLQNETLLELLQLSRLVSRNVSCDLTISLVLSSSLREAPLATLAASSSETRLFSLLVVLLLCHGLVVGVCNGVK